MQMTVAASSAGADGTVSPALKHDDEATGTQIWFEDAMTKVFPDSLPVGAAPSSIRLDIARDEHAPFQVAIRPAQDLAHVSLRFSTNQAAEEHGSGGEHNRLQTSLAGLGCVFTPMRPRCVVATGVQFEVRQVVHVNVSRPTGNRTGLFPDALPLLKPRGSDASASVNLRAGVTTSFWLSFRTVAVETDDVAQAQARGGCDVQGSVEARAGSESLGRLPLCITARSFSGPCHSRALPSSVARLVSRDP